MRRHYEIPLQDLPCFQAQSLLYSKQMSSPVSDVHMQISLHWEISGNWVSTHCTDGQDGGLVHEVHDVGAGVARRRARDAVEGHARRHALVPRVHLVDLDPPLRQVAVVTSARGIGTIARHGHTTVAQNRLPMVGGAKTRLAH